MASLPENSRSTDIVARAKGIIVDPSAEWAKIALETDQPKQVFMRYVLPLAAIGPISSFIGMQVFGISMLGFSMKFTFVQALTVAIATYVMALISVWVVAFIANLLSPKFGGRDDLPAAFRLIAYGWTASWLAGIFGLYPALSILSLVGLYSLYLLYKGVTPVMSVPQDKATVYTVVTVLCAFVAMFVANLVVSGITAPIMLSAASSAPVGQMSIDMGEAGSMQTGPDGSVTMTGPDGEKITINVDGTRTTE